MRTLLEAIEAHSLNVTNHEPSTISIEAPVRDGSDNRFELELLEWESDLPLQAWRGNSPEELLNEGLAWAKVREAGQGVFRMSLVDRYGGEKVRFLSSDTDNAFPDTIGFEETENYSKIDDPFDGLEVADLPAEDPFIFG